MAAPRVLVLIPTAEKVETECLAAVRRQKYENFSVLIHVKKPVSHTDNHVHDLYTNCTDNLRDLRRMALASDADYFLTLDSDIILPENAIQNLISQRKELVGGWYRMILAPLYVAGKWIADNTFLHYLKPPRDLEQVDMIGHGCMLVSRAAMQKLDFPTGLELTCKSATLNQDVIVGACGAFGNLAHALGLKMYMCGAVHCGHKDRKTGAIII